MEDFTYILKISKNKLEIDQLEKDLIKLIGRKVENSGPLLNILDGDYLIEFSRDIPNFEQAIILEIDKRYNFDPSSSWTLNMKIVRGEDSIFLVPTAKYLTFNIEPVKKYFKIKEGKENEKI